MPTFFVGFVGGYISDFAFAKWNRQMFKYDKNSSDLVY